VGTFCEVGSEITSGFRRHAGEICALRGYYVPLSGNPLPTFRDNVSVPSSKVKKSLEDGTNTLSGNVGKHHSMPCNIPKERRSEGRECVSAINMRNFSIS
jgi:hypothetical protein